MNWEPSVTVYPTGVGVPYGDTSWTALWTRILLVDFRHGLYFTIVELTFAPDSGLILEFFRPQGIKSLHISSVSYFLLLYRPLTYPTKPIIAEVLPATQMLLECLGKIDAAVLLPC